MSDGTGSENGLRTVIGVYVSIQTSVWKCPGGRQEPSLPSLKCSPKHEVQYGGLPQTKPLKVKPHNKRPSSPLFHFKTSKYLPKVNRPLKKFHNPHPTEATDHLQGGETLWRPCFCKTEVRVLWFLRVFFEGDVIFKLDPNPSIIDYTSVKKNHVQCNFLHFSSPPLILPLPWTH